MGMIYKRGAIWWLKYYANGRCIRESTEQGKERVARDLLKRKEGRVAAGHPLLPKADRIRVEELLDDLRRHYETTGERNLVEADGRFAPLKAFFTGRRVAALNGTDFSRYAELRQKAGMSNATINRELSVLGRALRLGVEHDKVARIPIFHRLKEAAPRSGFFEREQFQAVRARLAPDLQVAVTLMYTFGWRSNSEVLWLPLSAVDLEAGTVCLAPGATKNDDARIVYVTPELHAMLTAQVERVKAVSRTLQRVVPYLFPHLKGKRAGTRTGNFRKAWNTACRVAGCPGMLRHDFRRTAVRNMVNMGIPERVAMTVTGHKTRGVFDRYHIVSPGDLQDAARKLAGTISGTVTAPSASPSSQVREKLGRARSSAG